MTDLRPRVVIEAVAPVVDCGRFAAKREVGDTVDVTGARLKITQAFEHPPINPLPSFWCNYPDFLIPPPSGDLRPGQANSVRTALNTRFDMYDNPFFGGGSDDSNLSYRPARNVTKGIIWTGSGGNLCNSSQAPGPPVAMGLPRDPGVDNDNRFGNGDWDCATYWATNHPDPVAEPAPGGCANPSTISRFDANGATAAS